MNTKNVLIVTLTGIAVCAALGVLFAPDKGTNLRKKISRKGEGLIEGLKGKFDDFICEIKDQIEALNTAGARARSFPIACECGSASCLDVLTVDAEHYNEVRADPHRPWQARAGLPSWSSLRQPAIRHDWPDCCCSALACSRRSISASGQSRSTSDRPTGAPHGGPWPRSWSRSRRRRGGTSLRSSACQRCQRFSGRIHSTSLYGT